MQTRELCSGSALQERAAGASSLVCTDLNVKVVQGLCLNLAIYMYTSEIITTTMLLLYTHFNTECGVQHNNSRRWQNYSLFVTKHPTEYARFSSDKYLILNTFKTFGR